MYIYITISNNTNEMKLSILQEMNSPTLGTETKASGRIIYDTIYNEMSDSFKIKIDITLVGNIITDYEWEIFGYHNISFDVQNEIVRDLILDNDDTLKFQH